MDGAAFDRLTISLAAADTRRALLRRLAALPLGGALTATLAAGPTAADPGDPEKGSSHRHRRRKTRNARRSGDDKDNRTGKRTSRKPCRPESRTKTCAGTCLTVKNNCGKPVDCGACTCATGCPPCQTCNPTTGQCEAVADGAACDDGDACTQSDSCQNGSCVGSNPKVCPAPDECHDPGTCDPATGECSNPEKSNGTECTGGFCCGGACRECCGDQDCPSGLCQGNKVCAPIVCTGDSCDAAGVVFCGRDVFTTSPCTCRKHADSNALFCSAATLGPCSAGTCPLGQTCVALHAPNCGTLDVCAIPCTHPT